MNKVEVKKQNFISKFNTNFALRATKIFGSMGTFYAFCIWACLPLIPILSNQKESILYISSGFIQLVALPLILVGQDLMNDKSEERAERTSRTVENSSKTLTKIVNDIGSVNTTLSNDIIENIKTTMLLQKEIVSIQTTLANDIASLKKTLKITE